LQFNKTTATRECNNVGRFLGREVKATNYCHGRGTYDENNGGAIPNGEVAKNGHAAVVSDERGGLEEIVDKEGGRSNGARRNNNSAETG
jgi:hypothetical protein